MNTSIVVCTAAVKKNSAGAPKRSITAAAKVGPITDAIELIRSSVAAMRTNSVAVSRSMTSASSMWARKEAVICATGTSWMSSSCFIMSWSSRSNGPSKTSIFTSKLNGLS